MQCTTVKNGHECFLMGKDGCTLATGSCQTIASQCEGCERVSNFPTGKYCNVFAHPASKWMFGGACNLATHIKREEKKEEKMLNPLKASKREAAGGGGAKKKK
jgi:hypothetical protein